MPGQDLPPFRAEARAEASDERFRIDWQALAIEFGGDRSFLCQLATALLDSHGKTPDSLREAVRTRDFAALAFLTHKVKGAVGSLMVVPLYELAKEAEEAARLDQLQAVDLADALVAPLQQLLVQASEYLAGCDCQGERLM